ncbi:nucleotidyltransferase domain-containing protein [uncultured Methanofollis sp.]|uniref:nucleotidyltransferase domain-containing protein n=1 Tax=uncultured Methanofollis sp. TaxID=262500 RepID=UPI002631CB96|nr:nucleotidyltransferase domain-containing protein [uncultured Methanofollis sp.]
MFGERVLAEIRRYAESEESIRAMVLTGSWARGEATEQSDVDVFLVAAKEREDVFSGLATALTGVQDVLAPIPEKRVFFLGERYLKAEVTVIADIGEMEELYRASRVRDPSHSVPVDKDGTVRATVAGWCFNGRETDLSSLTAVNVEAFLEGFELASRYAGRGDAYRFYHTYNEALAAYAALLVLKQGSAAHIDLPRGLVEGMDHAGGEAFRSLAGSLDLSEAPRLLQRLAAAFEDAYGVVYAAVPGLPRASETISRCTGRILRRDRMA